MLCFVGLWIGFWILDIGFWIGFWILDIGFWILEFVFWNLFF